MFRDERPCHARAVLDLLEFHAENALLSRLRDAAGKRDVVVLAGSGLTMPLPGVPGVPGVAGIVDAIRAELAGDDDAGHDLEHALQNAANPYQVAFGKLGAWRGPDAVNRVIRRAVLAARRPGAPRPPDAVLDEAPDVHRAACEELERDAQGWALSPGVESLGRLAARHPRFGQTILTTNFDPLIEIAIARAHGHPVRLDLGSDGSLAHTHGQGCRVVHLHGHWYGALTLHTPAQLLQPRDGLETSLRHLLGRGCVLLVLAYSGWDDVLTRTLARILADPQATPQVLWTFYRDDPARIRQESEKLLRDLVLGSGPSRVTLFRGIDVHRFLPRLADALVPDPRTVVDSVDRAAELAAYAAWARDELTYIETVGLGTGRLRLRLDQVFVPLGFRHHDLADAPDLDTEPSHRADRGDRTIHIEDAFTQVAPRPHVFLLGEPGAGKTTALRKLMRSLLGPGGNDTRNGAPSGAAGPAGVPAFSGRHVGLPERTVPVFIRLRQVAERLHPPHALAELVEDHFAALRRPDGTPVVSAGFGRWLCEQGHLLLLLDGLDEVADPAARVDVCAHLEARLDAAVAAGMTGLRIVVSARWSAFHDHLAVGDDRQAMLDPARFAMLEARPMSQEQSEQLVTQWIEEAERFLARVEGRGELAAVGRAQERAAALCTRMRAMTRGSRQMATLMGNPLLLTLLCVMYQDNIVLPERRTEFFEQALRILFRRRHGDPEAAGRPPLLDVDQALRLLEPVAWDMQCHPERAFELTPAEIEDIVEPVRKRLEIRRQEPLSFASVFEWLTGHAGVLAEYAPGRYGFLHLHFQEYLAARHASRQGGACVARLAAELGGARWEETILMFAGLAEPPRLEDLIERVAATDELVAAEEILRRCLEEAPDPPTDPLARVIADVRRDAGSRAAALRLVQRRADEKVQAAAVQAARTAVRGSDLRRLAESMALGSRPDISVPGEPQPFTDKTTGIRFLWVPGGTFVMGAEDLSERERPPHRVQLSGFWLAETPVTNRQYEKFLAQQREIGEPRFWRDRRFNQPGQPVVGVSWMEAREYCRWLGRVSGQRIELPTEAQWELAARGEEGRKYPWGDDEPNDKRAFFGKSWDTGAPLPVGTLPAGQGPYGHDDLAGNVWEWCLDPWDDHSYENRGPLAIDPPDPAAVDTDLAAARACRGGAYGSVRRHLRAACRGWSHAVGGARRLGFRVAALPTPR
jgi:formylglycine-generating enzyme required for sulfatase activity